MEIFKIIFFHELKILFKSIGKAIDNVLYFFIFLAIFQILTQNFEKNLHSQLFVIGTIIALLTSIITINNDFLEKDFRDGSLEQIIIDCQNLEIFVIAKCLANWLSSSFLITIPLNSHMFDITMRLKKDWAAPVRLSNSPNA